jgi:hypothetical protein
MDTFGADRFADEEEGGDVSNTIGDGVRQFFAFPQTGMLAMLAILGK